MTALLYQEQANGVGGCGSTILCTAMTEAKDTCRRHRCQFRWFYIWAGLSWGLAGLTLWLTTYGQRYTLRYAHYDGDGARRLSATVYDGHLTLGWSADPQLATDPARGWLFERVDYLTPVDAQLRGPALAAFLDRHRRQGSTSVGGQYRDLFGWRYVRWDRSGDGREVGAPLAHLAALLSGWSVALAAATTWRRRRRAQRGLCTSCGYDLRANTPAGRCPECGSDCEEMRQPRAGAPLRSASLSCRSTNG